MHLPGPIRAAVGLVASAADEVRSLPERAVELPMLAVSTALQVSLRAQQRYAQLAARGEQVLNRDEPGAEPPAWATFDDPVSADDLRRTALTQLDSLIDGSFGGVPDDDREDGDRGDGAAPADPNARTAGRMFEQLFGVSDPAAGGEAAVDGAVDGAAAGPVDGGAGSDSGGDSGGDAVVVPITQAVAGGRSARKTARKTARKSPAKKAPVKKAAAKKAPAKKAPAKKAASDEPKNEQGSKQVNKPRHAAPSKFDDVDD